LLHDRHRIRRWRIGRPDELRGFTRDDVTRFYRNFYTPSNTVLAIAGDVEQTHVEIGWRTVPNEHPDVAALDLAAAVLGSGRASRLYRAVRDRKLAGSAGAYNYSPAEVGVFVMSSEGDPATAPDAARAMWAQLAAVRAGEVSADEVERAHKLFMSRW